ncbi:MAG: ferrous iron transporter B, partial [candidate division WOR-3 bacterium]
TYVITSNYPGTTVEFTKGYTEINGEKVEVIDVPGAYTLEPTNTAEEVAVKMLEEANREKDCTIIQVIDATNLERNLILTLQLLSRDLPLLIALNLWDEAKHLGIQIDFQKLEGILGVPVVPTVAITGEGIKELKEKIPMAKKGKCLMGEKWQEIGRIIDEVQKVSHRHHTFSEKLNDLTIRPTTGLPLALIILYLVFLFVRLGGESLTTYLLDPIFNKLYLPFLARIINQSSLPKFLVRILLGEKIEPLSGLGLLTTGPYIPFVIVFPYLFVFYLLLSLLEDIGYLPRLATLLDTFFHRLGVHGYSSVPIILGFGCKVPALLATRLLERKREKIITTALLMMMAPCLPQSAMIVSLIAPYGTKYLFLVFGLLFFLSLIVSFLLSKIFRGETLELFLEIPPYRRPVFYLLWQKTWLRLKGFLKEAVPLILGGVFLISILEISGVIELIGKFLGKPLLYLLDLPERTIGVITTGFLRKDVSIALLAPLNLTLKQLVIASIFLTLYLPCLSTFFVMGKELGGKNLLKVAAIQLLSGLSVCFILNQVLSGT